MKNINDNVIANRWKQRYAQQPDRIKEKLDELEKKELKDYQLQVIKRKRAYPQIGDIFEINPKDDIILYGIRANSFEYFLPVTRMFLKILNSNPEFNTDILVLYVNPFYQ